MTGTGHYVVETAHLNATQLNHLSQEWYTTQNQKHQLKSHFPSRLAAAPRPHNSTDAVNGLRQRHKRVSRRKRTGGGGEDEECYEPRVHRRVCVQQAGIQVSTEWACVECDCPLVLEMEIFEECGHRTLQHQALIITTVIRSQLISLKYIWNTLWSATCTSLCLVWTQPYTSSSFFAWIISKSYFLTEDTAGMWCGTRTSFEKERKVPGTKLRMVISWFCCLRFCCGGYRKQAKFGLFARHFLPSLPRLSVSISLKKNNQCASEFSWDPWLFPFRCGSAFAHHYKEKNGNTSRQVLINTWIHEYVSGSHGEQMCCWVERFGPELFTLWRAALRVWGWKTVCLDKDSLRGCH